MSGYTYQTLDPENETRLLKITPRTKDDDCPIVADLVHTSLASPLPYEALSYVWGNSVVGVLSDVDPDTEGYGYLRVPTEAPRNIFQFKCKDFASHPDLQYALWSAGFPRPKGTIILGGTEVEVGGELYSALNRLGHLWQGTDQETKEGVYVWIDALCINQNDIEERNIHVKKMGQIYKKAKRVRIWLGEASSDADRIAFDALLELNFFFADVYEYVDRSDHAAVRQRFVAEPAMRNLNWACIGSLLRRSWFTRTWVIQEIAYARSAYVHLSAYGCNWDLLSSVLMTLRILDLDQPLWAYNEYTADSTVGLMDRLHWVENQRSINDEGASIEELRLVDILQASRDFKCTMSHDKIYGVLNLAADSHKFPVPDYSLTVEEIFKGFAKTSFSMDNGLEILYHCCKSHKRSELSLPSWVPDWTQKCHHIPFYSTALKCEASRSSAPEIKLSDDESILTVRGKVLGRIQRVDHVRNIPRNSLQAPKHAGTIESLGGKEEKLFLGADLDRTTYEEWIIEHRANLRDWLSNVMEIAFPDRVMDSVVFEALWRTFVCNQTRKGEIPPAQWGSQFANFVQGTKEKHVGDEGLRVERILNSEPCGNPRRGKWDLTEDFDRYVPLELSAYMDFVRTNGTWCYNRRFFKTEDGRFGWGPNAVSEGDLVAIVHGLHVPLVLRPVQGGHEIVGDCYAHGLMLGEGMDMEVESTDLLIL